MTDQEKISSILRHMKRVEDNCNLLSRKLQDADSDFARKLVKLGRIHDASKLDNYEFDRLWPDAKDFGEALNHHRLNNPHHPEYWKNIRNMPKIYVAEMVCDCLARAQEFGTDIREWFFGKSGECAPSKYGYKEGDEVWNLIDKYLKILLIPSFNAVDKE